MGRCLLWRGPGSLIIRGGVRAEVLVPPADQENSGLIRRAENIAAIGEAVIKDLIASGRMEEVTEYDGPERRAGERRQGDRRHA